MKSKKMVLSMIVVVALVMSTPILQVKAADNDVTLVKNCESVVLSSSSQAKELEMERILNEFKNGNFSDIAPTAFAYLAYEVENGMIHTDEEAIERLAELMTADLKMKSGGSDYLVKAEKMAAAVDAVGLVKAAQAKADADAASAAAVNSGLPGIVDGQADAFRHAFWNARMSRSIGVANAEKIGNIHEEYNPGTEISHTMDYFNNRRGREIYQSFVSQGLSTTDANLQTNIKNQIFAGTLRIIRDGQVVPSNSNPKRVKPQLWLGKE